MAKKFRVTWNEIYCCASEVEADSYQQAIEIALNNEPDQKEYGESDEAQAEEITDEED